MYNSSNKKSLQEIPFMKPRIFISSTFYDLKYVREDIANFVKTHGYEPVLFEDGDIGYTPGKYLDESCYDAMKTSDMVILIIGGEYGSEASREKNIRKQEENEKKNPQNFSEYMSITRREFRTAIESGIPIFVMIDKKIMVEYGIYEENLEDIENKKITIKFKATKNINVFHFIKEIKSIVTLPILEFERASEIKDFIEKQWADMFKTYLHSLKNEAEQKEIQHSVSEMKELIQKMNIMLNSVGKSILTKDGPEKYENVVNQQEIISFCEIVTDSFRLTLSDMNSNRSRQEREEILSIFLSNLYKAHTEKCWNETDSEARKKHIAQIMNNDKFKVWGIADFYFTKIGEKYKLLYDQESRKRIIDILVGDKYFNTLVRN